MDVIADVFRFGEVLDGKSIIRKIEGLKTQNDKPIWDVTISGKHARIHTRWYRYWPKTIDCGQLSGDEAANVGKKVADSTGDPYEDFPEDQGDELKGPEIIKIARELKDYGNNAFKAVDLNLALDKYQKGLRYLNEYPEASDNDPPELQQQLTAIRFTLNSNSALIQIKLKAFDDASKSASNAVEIANIGDADKAKAYYRKALACIGLKNDEEAMNDLEMALKLAPGDAAIKKELGIVKRKAADQAKKEKAAYKKFFDWGVQSKQLNRSA